jgi:hypothetical protein
MNDQDFQASPNYNYKERDRESGGTKTYQVTMIEGTPYQRLIAVNDEPLSKEQVEEENRKQEHAASARRAESPEKHRARIAEYEKERKRDHAMMGQLTAAFDFAYIGQRRVRKFNVYVLRATPRSSYKPPSMELQVLKGMEGELWIEKLTYHWVRVSARVIRPVSIQGFLAEVEPGTLFGMEMAPVDENIWQISRFTMKSHAKILHMFKKASEEDETYYDYQPVRAASK